MIPVDWKSLFEPALASTGVPGSGHVTALRNTRKVRIEWGDCDPAGIIFYPRYFEIFDASTSALFERALGHDQASICSRLSTSPAIRWRARARASSSPRASATT